MFLIKDPNTLDKPWILSRFDKEPRDEIPTNVTKLMKNYQVLPVEFLYHNLRKGRTGAILNQDDGMDFPLQIAAFFRAILKVQSLVLVLCPDYLISDWNYNLSVHGNFDVIIVQNCKNLENKLNRNGKNQALVLGLTELKLADNLIDLDLFSVVVQNFDEVANKRILRYLKGNFNIGLSTRSFYKYPDQKLQWTMLDWANSGCVGKLKDFYECDNNNFAKLLDNYRIWWQRLTWTFCESFKKPTEAELEILKNQVKAWAKKHNLPVAPSPPSESKARNKRKSLTVIRTGPVSSSKIPKTEKNSQPSNKPMIVVDQSRLETVVESVSIGDNDIKSPDVDENPILTSIVKNMGVSHGTPSSLCIQPTCSKTSTILSQLIENSPPEPLLRATKSSEDFLVDLVTSSNAKEPDLQPTDLIGEIDRILAETDGLL